LHADNVHAVRVGRRVELTVEADSADSARSTVDSLAGDFLANPLIESWAIEEMPAR
jgi:phosphoribosylformylglycinamidine (FGAM) synthase PurS component